MEPLSPWLQEDVPDDVIGINPADCLVFLAPTDWEDLPEVPEDQPADDEDLPFVKDITSPKPWVCFSFFKTDSEVIICLSELDFFFQQLKSYM